MFKVRWLIYQTCHFRYHLIQLKTFSIPNIKTLSHTHIYIYIYIYIYGFRLYIDLHMKNEMQGTTEKSTCVSVLHRLTWVGSGGVFFIYFGGGRGAQNFASKSLSSIWEGERAALIMDILLRKASCALHYFLLLPLSTLYFDPVTENEICKIIGSFNDSAAGWDDLKSCMIKHIKESMIVPLVHICNRSFVTVYFQVNWK